MEQVIGIFDGQAGYAEQLARYINERKDIGCFAVVFRKEEELLAFGERRKLSSLIVGGKSAEELLQLKEKLPVGVRLWRLSEEAAENGDEGILFRYQKAEHLIRLVLAEAQNSSALRMSELFVVFSPECGRMAAGYAISLAEQLTKGGRTLFLPWDAYLGYGRNGRKETEIPSLSELLYFVRRDTGQAKKLFAGIRRKSGVEYFCGPDYSTDLWQYSPEEMQRLLLCCKEYGGYEHIVFLAGVFQDGTAAVMRQSSRVYLVCSKTKEGEDRKREFFRQMKYAGEQEILSKIEEAEGREAE